MPRRTLTWALLATTMPLVAAAVARADATTATNYDTFDKTVAVSAAASPALPGTPTANSTSVSVGDVTVNLGGSNESGLNASGPGTDSILGTVSVAKADVGTTQLNINYDLRVALQDASTPTPQTVDVTGVLTGTVTKTASGSLAVNMQNLFSPSMYTTTLGNSIYTINAEYFTSPGPNGVGTFGAHITAFPVPTPAVEPASLALWGAGGLAVAGLRRRRRLARG